jgi:sugar/nucleoside kinase (ribokinase family)
MRVLVVGSIGIDDIETPFEKADGVLGGSATYASIASAFHASTGLVSIVGQDFSAEQRGLLSDRGIDLAGVQVAKGETFRWGGRYHANYDDRDTTFTELNVLSMFDPEIPRSYRDSRYVLLGNVDPSAQLKVLDQLKNPEVVVVDTMNYWLESAPDQVEKVMARSDIAVINEEEVRLYSGHHSIPKAAEHMMDCGLRAVVIKRGAYGAAMRTDEGWFFVAGYPLMEVKDPTGAGDSLAGGLVGYLAREDHVTEQSLRRAIVHGSVLASLAVQSFGAEGLAGATRSEIDRRYQDFLRFSQVDIEESVPQPAEGASE